MIDNPESPVTPSEYWRHCAQEWKNVEDGAHEAGNLPAELFFHDLQESAEYVTTLVQS